MSSNRTTIVKSKLHRDFTIIPNEILKRTDVSLQAKGLFCYILSLPDDWIVYKNKLAVMTGESRRQINNAFAELEKKGYLISTDVYRRGLKQKEYVFYQFPFNEIPTITQNDTWQQTDTQNELAITRNEQAITRNEHLLSTNLINTKLEKEKTITTTENSDFFSFDEKIKVTHKSYRDRLMKDCNKQLRQSIEKTSNKKFTEEDIITFNVHLALENKLHDEFGEYCKHLRNWLGKNGNYKKK